jgi:hypothetical protein
MPISIFNKDSQIKLIIESSIQELFENNPNNNILLENKLSYEDSFNLLYDHYRATSKLLREEFPDFYNLLENDKSLFTLFYSDEIKSLLYEDFSVFAPLILKAAGLAIGTLTAIKLKIPGKIVDSLRSISYYIGKKLTKFGEPNYLKNYLISNIPPECLSKLKTFRFNPSELNNPEELSKRVFNTFMSNMKGTNDITYAKISTFEPEFTHCLIEYLIKITGVSLMLFYKCLFDNKQYMDLINIKKLPTESILHLDRTFAPDMLNVSKSACFKFYQDFQNLYKLTLDVIGKFYPKFSKDYAKYFKKLNEAINEASKFAQKLLDEGKKKKEEQQSKSNNRR